MGSINVVVVALVLHLWRRDQGRSVKTRAPPHGLWEAAHMEPTSYGWRTGPAH